MIELSEELIADFVAPPVGYIEVGDLTLPGLRLRLRSTGLKTFVLRKRVGSRVRSIMIGHHHPDELSLEQARAKARTLAALFERNGELTSPGSGDMEAMNVSLERYLAAKARLRSRGEIERIFRLYVIPVFGHRRPDSLSRVEISHFIDSLPTPSVARSVAAQLSAYYSWLLPRSETLACNPCRSAAKPRALRPRDRVLSNVELRQVWKAASVEPIFGPGIQLLLLTLQRRGEVFGADYREFDLPSKLWSIPAKRTKNGRVHEVPLSEAAATLIEKMSARSSGKLFPAKGRPEASASGFSKAWARVRDRVDKALGTPAERFTMHDLRRTGATQLQRLGVRVEVTEALLNHVGATRGGIVGVYQRYEYDEEKRLAIDSWAAELRRIVTNEDCRTI